MLRWKAGREIWLFLGIEVLDMATWLPALVSLNTGLDQSLAIQYTPNCAWCQMALTTR
jgi:hypothetical protein